MQRVFKVIYETDTGEVLGGCPACAVYSFQSEEVAQYHFDSMGIANRSMADITYEEKIALSEYDPEKNRARFQVDIKNIKRYLKDRKKEEFTVNEFGVSYQDKRPARAVISK